MPFKWLIVDAWSTQRQLESTWHLETPTMFCFQIVVLNKVYSIFFNQITPYWCKNIRWYSSYFIHALLCKMCIYVCLDTSTANLRELEAEISLLKVKSGGHLGNPRGSPFFDMCKWLLLGIERQSPGLHVGKNHVGKCASCRKIVLHVGKSCFALDCVHHS